MKIWKTEKKIAKYRFLMQFQNFFDLFLILAKLLQYDFSNTTELFAIFLSPFVEFLKNYLTSVTRIEIEKQFLE